MCSGGKWGACGTAPKATDICDYGNDDMCTGTPVGGSGNTQCVCNGFTMPNPATAGLPNPASYTDNGDGTITDKVTGLVWEKSPSPTVAQCIGSGTATATFPAVTCGQGQALAYCAGKGGGWRLPSRVELVSLVDFTIASPGPTINAALPGTPGDRFWTSAPFAASAGFAWYVDFKDGATSFDFDTAHYRVRCVR